MKAAVEPVAAWRTKGEPSWLAISRSDLESWAGKSTVKRARTYANAGRVKELCRTDAGGLLAWVQGTRRYAVLVEPLVGGTLSEANCTCPVGYQCKHAVAAIFACQDQLLQQKAIPVAKPGDTRLRRVEEADGGYDDDEDDYAYDIEDESDIEDEEEADPWPTAARGRRSRKPPANSSLRIEAFRYILADKSRTELVNLLIDWARRHPELAEPLLQDAALASRDPHQLLEAARAELHRVSSLGPIRNGRTYSHEGIDYDQLRQMLERLLELGMANYLLPLGVELLQAAIRQTEGLRGDCYAYGTADCLLVVWDAVELSSLSRAEQLLFYIFAICQDDYSLCESAADYLEGNATTADWVEVADVLVSQVRDRHPERTYFAANRLLKHTLVALRRSGQEAKCLELLEHLARKHHSFDAVIDYCLQEQRYPEAEDWIKQSLAVVEPHLRGVIATRTKQLAEVARLAKKWKKVAAVYAEKFFSEPSVDSLRQLLATAAKAKCQDAVRTGALAFLETGKSPGKHSHPTWPLEDVVEMRRFRPAKLRPQPWLLLQLAIVEQRTEDALGIYDRERSIKQPKTPFFPTRSIRTFDEPLAQLLASTHPERAAELYEELALAAAAEIGEPFYAKAAQFLKNLRAIRDRQGDRPRFVALLEKIRTEHRRKTKLIKELAKLDAPARRG
jgi:uncharacterized Zn finger protein